MRAHVMPSSPTRLNVVLIEDVREVREGLSCLIDEAAGFRCAAACRTMEEAIASSPWYKSAFSD